MDHLQVAGDKSGELSVRGGALDDSLLELEPENDDENDDGTTAADDDISDDNDDNVSYDDEDEDEEDNGDVDSIGGGGGGGVGGGGVENHHRNRNLNLNDNTHRRHSRQQHGHSNQNRNRNLRNDHRNIEEDELLEDDDDELEEDANDDDDGLSFNSSPRQLAHTVRETDADADVDADSDHHHHHHHHHRRRHNHHRDRSTTPRHHRHHHDVVDDISEYGNSNFHREEAAAFFRRITAPMEETIHNNNNNNDNNIDAPPPTITVEQCKATLLQLHSNWEQILDNSVYDLEQYIETINREKEDIELRLEENLDEQRILHEKEIAAVKDQVMEQSQKIILQEMKVNAERERMCEDALESRIDQAVEEAKIDLNEEFEIALSGMKQAQEDMEGQYQKMMKETEIRVRDEVYKEANDQAESKIGVFQESYDEMKQQVVDMTLEIQRLEVEVEVKVEEVNAKHEEEQKLAVQKLELDHQEKINNLETELESQAKELEIVNSAKEKDMNRKIEELSTLLQQKETKLEAKATTTSTATVTMDQEAHVFAINDLTNHFEFEIKSILSKEAKDAEEAQHIYEQGVEALKECHEAQLSDLRKELELEKETAVLLLNTKLEEVAATVDRLKKEHDDVVEQLKKDHEIQMQDKKRQFDEELTQSLSTSKDELAKVQEELDTYKNQRGRAQDHNDETLAALRETHTKNMTSLKKNFEEEMDKKNAKHQSMMKELREQVITAQTQSDNKMKLIQEQHQDEVDRLKKELGTETTDAIKEANTQISGLKDKLNDRKAEVKNLKESFTRAKGALVASDSALTDLQAKVKASDGRLAKEKSTHEAELEQMKIELEKDKASSISELQGTISELQDQLQASKDSSSQIETDFKQEIDSALADLQSKVKAADERLAKEKSTHEAELEQMKTEFEKDKTSSISELQGTISELQDQLQASKDSSSQIQTDFKQEIDSALADLQSKVKASDELLAKEKSDHEAELEEMKTEFEKDKASSISELQGTISELQDQLQASKDSSSQIQTDFNKEIEQLKQELTAERENNSVVKNDMDVLKLETSKELTSYREKLEILTTELSTEKSKSLSSQDDISNLKREIEKLTSLSMEEKEKHKAEIESLMMGMDREKSTMREESQESSSTHQHELMANHKAEIELLKINFTREEAEAQNALAALQNKLETTESLVCTERKRHDEEVEQLKKELEKAITNSRNSENSISVLKQELEKVKTESRQSESSISVLQRELDAMVNASKTKPTEGTKNQVTANREPMQGDTPEGDLLPVEIQVQPPATTINYFGEETSDHSITSPLLSEDADDSQIPTPPSVSSKITPKLKEDAQQFPELSPLTLGSPGLRGLALKKSKVAPNVVNTKETHRDRDALSQRSISSRRKTMNQPSNSRGGPKTPRHSLNLTSSRMGLIKKTRSTSSVSSRTSQKNMLSPRQSRLTSSVSAIGSPIATMDTSDIRVMVINVPITERLKKMIRALKLDMVEDPLLATHVVAGDPEHSMRRTWKLMAALCVTSNILKAEWIEESYKFKRVLTSNRFLLLNDTSAETTLSFSMKNTLREGAERRKDGGLFAGWRILIAPNVAGNRAPKEAELHTMIGAAGGIIITRDNIPLPLADDPTHVIVLTSNPPHPDQINDTKAQMAADNGAGFYTTVWLFDCMIHQKLFGIKRGLGRV